MTAYLEGFAVGFGTCVALFIVVSLLVKRFPPVVQRKGQPSVPNMARKRSPYTEEDY